MPFTAKQVIKIIEKDGWYRARVKGSHYIFKHPIKKGIVPVPVHPGDMREGTVKNIFILAGLKESINAK